MKKGLNLKNIVDKMSTKIYNGIIFKSNNIEEILSQLQSVREKIINTINKDCKSFFNYKALYAFCRDKKDIFDIIKSDDKNISYKAFSVINIIQDYLKLDDTDATWLIPFNFDVYIIPYKGKCIVGGVFADNDKCRNFINEYIDDFHYQNQCDKPDEISDEEWEVRENIWNDVFEKYYTFPEVGFHYSILKSEDLLIGSFATLVKEVINDIIANEK